MPAQTWRVMSKTLATLNVLASKMLMIASSLNVAALRFHLAISAELLPSCGRRECNVQHSCIPV